MSSGLSAYTARLAGPDHPERGHVHAGFLSQLAAMGILWRCGALAAAHLLERILLLASWFCVGAAALDGRLEYGWLLGCGLFLASTVPLHAASTWLQGVVAVGFGGLLKERLLIGAMAMDATTIRRKGAGELISEVIDLEAIDNLGANGGIAVLLALLELLISPFVFLSGTDAALQIGLLLAVAVILSRLIASNMQIRLEWTRQRAALTNDLVENMTAHRTRIVQQPAADWHLREDQRMERYLQVSRRLDESTALIEAALPRGYVLAAFALLAPGFLGGGNKLEELTICLGTILFTGAALERFCLGYVVPAAAWAAWKQVQPVYQAGRTAEPDQGVAGVTAITNTVLQARDLTFSYPHRQQPILRACSLTVEAGEQILLQGPSGSGKSTLSRILSGAHTPSDGFVLSGGLDRKTLGNSHWRRRIALVPQYHENHVFTAPLIFNLLLARARPYLPEDIAEAVSVCRELGLGGLLSRMPDGVDQLVGDTGWRLSQGERSRIFLARALLQRAEVVIVDETLAALDPKNLRQCLECVMRRAPTAIVIAHP